MLTSDFLDADPQLDTDFMLTSLFVEYLLYELPIELTLIPLDIDDEEDDDSDLDD